MEKAIKFLQFLQLQKLSFLSQNTYDINKSEVFLFFFFILKRSLGFRTECEKEVYEIQLVQLQEQLESAMIEKEQMGRSISLKY